ncbi:type II toxin-antitoxin system VapC family toxin [Fibrella arboris]|uniref:type II toxin-antitoxin system VapC family toxin n=1 Tax=Fibrella arboris TaxID=3242486 RepID=UPI0035230389
MSGLIADSFILVDTGVMSRYFLGKPQITKAYAELTARSTPVITGSVYIELMQWLIKARGRATQALTKSEFDQLRHQLDKYIQLNHNDCIDLAVAACRLYPDTGLGDCFTIGVGLFFDVPIFTLNQKHFERIPSVRLYTPENYALLERD